MLALLCLSVSCSFVLSRITSIRSVNEAKQRSAGLTVTIDATTREYGISITSTTGIASSDESSSTKASTSFLNTLKSDTTLSTQAVPSSGDPGDTSVTVTSQTNSQVRSSTTWAADSQNWTEIHHEGTPINNTHGTVLTQGTEAADKDRITMTGSRGWDSDSYTTWQWGTDNQLYDWIPRLTFTGVTVTGYFTFSYFTLPEFSFPPEIREWIPYITTPASPTPSSPAIATTGPYRSPKEINSFNTAYEEVLEVGLITNERSTTLEVLPNWFTETETSHDLSAEILSSTEPLQVSYWENREPRKVTGNTTQLLTTTMTDVNIDNSTTGVDNQTLPFKKEFGETEDIILIGCNTVLVVTAVIFNNIVIKFYKHQLKKLIPFIYFSVALADLITAVSCLLHPVILILLLFSSSQDTLISTLTLVCFFISSTSIRVGVFYNLVLSIVRSINIVQPFYQVKLGIVKIATALYPVIWSAIAAFDVYWVVKLGYMRFPKALFKHMIYRPMSSSGLAVLILREDATYLEIILFGMTIPFLVPAILVSICFIFQMYYLSISKTEMKQGSRIVSRRPAITIFQLTLLFLVCNLTATAVFIYFYAPSGSQQRKTGARDARIMYVSSCILHVFNATFSPLIMILRGRSLKRAIQSELQSFKSRFSSRYSSSARSAGVKATVYRY